MAESESKELPSEVGQFETNDSSSAEGRSPNFPHLSAKSGKDLLLPLLQSGALVA
jgi:hypothetical protein